MPTPCVGERNRGGGTRRGHPLDGQLRSRRFALGHHGRHHATDRCRCPARSPARLPDSIPGRAQGADRHFRWSDGRAADRREPARRARRYRCCNNRRDADHSHDLGSGRVAPGQFAVPGRGGTGVIPAFRTPGQRAPPSPSSVRGAGHTRRISATGPSQHAIPHSDFPCARERPRDCLRAGHAGSEQSVRPTGRHGEPSATTSAHRWTRPGRTRPTQPRCFCSSARRVPYSRRSSPWPWPAQMRRPADATTRSSDSGGREPAQSQPWLWGNPSQSGSAAA